MVCNPVETIVTSTDIMNSAIDTMAKITHFEGSLLPPPAALPRVRRRRSAVPFVMAASLAKLSNCGTICPSANHRPALSGEDPNRRSVQESGDIRDHIGEEHPVGV